MDCDRIERDEVIEKYLTGRLDEAQQKEFEAHFFGCRECMQKLQVSRMLQEKLWEKGDKILVQKVKPERLRVGRRVWAYTAAAAVLIIAAAALWWQLRGPGRAQAGKEVTPSLLAMLARFNPPPYIPAALRGVADEAGERFRAGMTLYEEGRYDAAIPDLRVASDLNPKGAGIRFFLGICLLLTGQTDAGIGELQTTISLGESVYLEEAHFYLAKVFIGKGDISSAKEELNWVLERGANLTEEAAQILAQLQ